MADFRHVITVEKAATFTFPDAIFTPEHLAMVREYSQAAREEIHTDKDLRIAIANYWAEWGEGYAEPYACHILTHAHDAKLSGVDAPIVLINNERVEVTDGDEYAA